MSSSIWERSWKAHVKSASPLTLEEGDLRIPELPPFAGAGVEVEITAVVYDKHSRKAWATAYATQGLSDLDVYSLLNQAHTDRKIAYCHVLHYLQMATEKIGKAWLLQHTNTPIAELRTSHLVVKKFSDHWLKDQASKASLGGNKGLATNIKSLMGDIERLAPAVERENHPMNVEYPWSTQTSLAIPCTHNFSSGWSHSSSTFQNLALQLRTAGAKCAQ